MPLRFNERESAISGSFLLVVLLAVSLVLVAVYNVEGAGGPLHSIQSAVGSITSPIRTAGAGLQAAESAAETSLADLTANPSTVSELKAQNEELRQMVAELEEYRQEAERIKAIQELSETYGIEGYTCHVIGVTGESWNRVLTIDRGAADGVSVGLPVMGSSGLVGQVKSVTDGTADVRLLQDPSSGVAVMLQKSRAEGLLKGNIDGLLYLEDVDADVKVKVGDTVVTSGLGGGYFRGLIVGTVARVGDSNGQSIRQIVVAPNDSVSGLEEVMVVTAVSKKKNAADADPDAANKKSDDSAKAESSDESGEEESADETDESADEEYSDEYTEEGADYVEGDEGDVVYDESQEG